MAICIVTRRFLSFSSRMRALTLLPGAQKKPAGPVRTEVRWVQPSPGGPGIPFMSFVPFPAYLGVLFHVVLGLIARMVEQG